MRKVILIYGFLFGVLFSFFNLQNACAQWVPTNFPASAAWTMCETANGSFIVAEFDLFGNGDLYFSDNQGETWEECIAEKHHIEFTSLLHYHITTLPH